MTTYTINPGQSNFRPLERPWPIFRPTGFEVRFRILPGGWCSLEEWGNDRDWEDWQKIKGITHFLSPNDRRTAMGVFAFGDAPETYKIGAYTNDKKGNHQHQRALIIEAEQWCTLQCCFEPRLALFQFSTQELKVPVIKLDFNDFKIGREVGTFAGGSNNAPGPYGGKAIKRMLMEAAFKPLKHKS